MEPLAASPVVKTEPEELGENRDVARLLSLPTLSLGEVEPEESPCPPVSPDAAMPPAWQTVVEAAGRAEVEERLSSEMSALKVADLDAGDVRRSQLTSRAGQLALREEEKKKKELEKMAKKAHESAQSEPAKPEKGGKSRGRPRKAASEPLAEEGVDKSSGSLMDSQPVPVGETKRRKLDSSATAGVPKKRTRTTTPEAKKKSDKKRKSASQGEAVATVDEVMKLEMRALLLKWKDHSYDKAVETMHKGKFKESQIVVYWTRDATGVKVLKDGKWCQVCYYSKFAHMILAISAASKMAEQLDKHGVQWLDAPGGVAFDQILRNTALAAADGL